MKKETMALENYIDKISVDVLPQTNEKFIMIGAFQYHLRMESASAISHETEMWKTIS